MSNIYKLIHTGELVRVYRVSPRMHTGSWIETENIVTGERKKLGRKSDYVLVGEA